MILPKILGSSSLSEVAGGTAAVVGASAFGLDDLVGPQTANLNQSTISTTISKFNGAIYRQLQSDACKKTRRMENPSSIALGILLSAGNLTLRNGAD
jgi:hypothetical protein